MPKCITRSRQVFSIILFSDPEREPRALSRGLVVATPENKRKAIRFLYQTATSGASDPVPAMEFALRLKPQLIYLLTDGDFPDNKAVLDRISSLNQDGSVWISTILFSNQTNAEKAIVELMKQIAIQNGGTFKLVSVAAVR